MERLTKSVPSEDGMLQFAAQVAAQTDAGTVIYLYGTLGAGKTTFTRGFLRGCGYAGKVKSPTYTLVEPYEIDGKTIYHFDLYRVNEVSELKQIGIEEYFSPASICLIEWPENGVPLLPVADVVFHIAFAGEGRTIRAEALSERGKTMLRDLAQ